MLIGAIIDAVCVIAMTVLLGFIVAVIAVLIFEQRGVK